MSDARTLGDTSTNPLREELDKILLHYLNDIISPDYINKIDAPRYYYTAGDRIMELLTAKTTEALIQANYYRNHEHQHEFLDLSDPCYCGSDNCNICKLCGEENHD